jgi:hypothetical protein
MSLLDKASLIITPNAEKVGKLYSVIPSDGSGDLTVVRGTTATRVNSLGLVENVAVNEPRLNYDTVGGCPAILIEPQRTNLALRSEEFNDALWLKTNGATITANSEISPSGALNADLMTATAVFSQVQATHTVVSGNTYTTSMWIKRISGTGQVFFRSIENANTSITITNQWVRYSVTTTATSTTGRIGVQLVVSGDSVAIWGAQLELGAYPTSYIPTLGSIQTRNADGISNTSISPLIGQTEGTFFIDFQNKANEVTTGVVVRVLYTITDGTANNRFSHSIIKTSTRNYTDITIRSNNVTVSNINVDTPTGRFKIAVSYKIGATKMFINGVSVGTAGLSEIPIINRLFLGCSSTLGVENANVSINNFLTVKTALTDTECINLTTL